MSNDSASRSPSLRLSRRPSPDNALLLQHYPGTSVPGLSLLSARRPSWTPPYDHAARTPEPSTPHVHTAPSNLRHETIPEPESPEQDDGNFRQSLQIDMKGLVGDAVGNMSISPTSRDIVLAARKGLFIIDLEAPLQVPRFLPQGGTWDVADVQWNPHPLRAEYIVSTSSERLLIWNLLLIGKTAIEHILQSHYRAVTDINWHTSEPDLVCSTGIDSWIWAWDLRAPMKPVFGLCAFNAGGTQVKWNRQDQNILASSHMNEVLIWDRRKGSVPLLQIQAHNAKIYGIDWSHAKRNEIVTCSLDKTIKIWDIVESPAVKHEPRITFATSYPVWRARDLPFGDGVLSLPQRGDTTLEMWAHSDTEAPVETFEGHSDVVKEYVWRRQGVADGHQDGLEFQLITWSKDKTLRFWPVSRETMHKTGSVEKSTESAKSPRFPKDEWLSFRSPPIGNEVSPTLSAPIGYRSILAEVRVPPNPVPLNPVLLPHSGSDARGHFAKDISNHKGARSTTASSSVPSSVTGRRGGTMSKGSTSGKSAKMEPFTWLSSFRGDSAAPSRLSSESRPTSGPDLDDSGVDSRNRKRSASRVRAEDGHRDGESGSSLLDEISTVVHKLTPSKIKLEKYDLTKRRTCTFGLHGPWGETANVHVFIRVTFTFPRDYPQAVPPAGTPSVDIERSPLVSTNKRAYMQKQLREIRENRRPCLEPCLRFLLFADGGQAGPTPAVDSGSSSEDDQPTEPRKTKDFTVSILRDHKNLAEPRTSQGVFGPNGQLVCFFRSLPRIVRSTLREDMEASASLASRSTETVPRLFQSPALLSDAVRRLVLAASDRTLSPYESRGPEDAENILRIMNNLLPLPPPKRRVVEESRNPESGPGNYALLSKRLTTIYIKDVAFAVGAHRGIAKDYLHYVDDPAAFCAANAVAARNHGRFDHERAFFTIGTLFRDNSGPPVASEKGTAQWRTDGLAKAIISNLYTELLAATDVQMLAMLSIVILKVYKPQPRKSQPSSRQSTHQTSPVPATPSKLPLDYFSLRRRRKDSHPPPVSPPLPRLPPSPMTPLQAPSLSSSSSSRGSWSSLFNTGTVRHLMSGSHDPKETPGDLGHLHEGQSTSSTIPVPSGGRSRGSDFPLKKRVTREQTMATIPAKSWSQPPLDVQPASARITVTFSTTGHTSGRPTFSQVLQPQSSDCRQKAVTIDRVQDMTHEERVYTVVDLRTFRQMSEHVAAYAEMLFSWGLHQKRIQLLKALRPDLPYELRPTGACPSCSASMPKSRCTVCRIPVKGLSHTCLLCCHVTHLNCWQESRFSTCPAGCGCQCDGGFDF